MKINIIVAFFSTLLVSVTCIAQELKRNNRLNIPDIPGYMTLKADFHLHTVFSDGHVWPTFRVREAQQNGLDVISLTEHIDYEGFPNELAYNRERAFEIAEAAAENTEVLVVRGVEISPRVPPYHHNALFLKNVDKIPYQYMKDTHNTFIMKDKIERSELLAPFLEAQRQGGFVFYNHPSYNWWDKKDTLLFTDFHQELLDKEILAGVEVSNSGRYNKIAHEFAEKYDLTIICNSDEHYDIASRYKDNHRPMTLVFAKEKTEAAVAEALRKKRTLAYFRDYLVGRFPEADAFFRASIEIIPEKGKGKNSPLLKVHIKNTTQIPYRVQLKTDYLIEDLPLGQLIIPANETKTIILNPIWKYPKIITLDFVVQNILVSPEEALKTTITVPID
ncbi:phosphotransferase [Aureibaculum sp. A20]|uniref:Phosphotransferase n=1 Tax=Aureibaculum flavum TaxID=2795986 RepID=A0ABS0WTB8_9FLAO|nr:Sb-PDE family phosphodiesterase [Aureibaculum flavum]MBJ2175207.1 phosphotransferase [Aureibaculum flavum]